MGPIRFRAALACLIVSLLAAGAAYGIGRELRPVYQASGTIRVAVPSQGGISDPNVTAANDLATQYAQLVGSGAVQAMTARTLHVPVDSLNGTISGSTVGAQNIVQVTATAGSAPDAHARAAAAVAAVQRYLSSITSAENKRYLATLQSGIRATDPPAPPGAAAASAASQRQQIVGQGALDAAGNQPGFQVVDPSGGASETSPRPKLYAIVAFVVALILTARLAFVLSRSRSAEPVRT